MLFLPKKGKKVGFPHMREGLINCLFPYTNFYGFSNASSQISGTLSPIVIFFSAARYGFCPVFL